MQIELLTSVLNLLPIGVIIWRLDKTPRAPKGLLRLVWTNDLAFNLTGIGGSAHEEKTIGRFLDAEASMRLHKVSLSVIKDGHSLVLPRFKFKNAQGGTTISKTHFLPVGDNYMLVVLDQKRTNPEAEAVCMSLRDLVSKLESAEIPVTKVKKPQSSEVVPLKPIKIVGG